MKIDNRNEKIWYNFRSIGQFILEIEMSTHWDKGILNTDLYTYSDAFFINYS